MCSRFAELEDSKKALTRWAAIEMRQLVELVDDILRAEAYTNDKEIPSFGNSATTLSCAFCGGEVFQKVFRCKNKCRRDLTIDFTPPDIIAICPACYVDGRTCRCGKMTPFRLQSMEPMVASRNKVATWLRSSSKDLLSDNSEDDSDTGRHEIIELLVLFLSSCSWG
jgi:hypothetical protein